MCVRRAPLGGQILSISCGFWENLAKSYVGATPGGLAPNLVEILYESAIHKANCTDTCRNDLQRLIGRSPIHRLPDFFSPHSLGIVLVESIKPLSLADLRGGARGMRAPGVQILSISCSFWGNLAKSYVGAPPPPWRVGAPTSEKSWIRHWLCDWIWG